MDGTITTGHIKSSHNQELQRLRNARASFVALLRVSTKTKDLCRGTRIHNDIVRWGLLDMCSDALVTMYATCGALMKAKELFDVHESKDVCTWTTLISAFVNMGQGHDALNYFERMQAKGLPLDATTFTCVLRACGSIGAADKGEILHNKIVNQGLLGNNVVLGTALVDMYAKCSALEKARKLLEGLPARNVISWNALIVGYAQQDQGAQGLMCFEKMQREGISPDGVTFTSVLKSCAIVGALDKGEQIRAEVTKQGLLENNFSLGTALVDMYVKCGALTKAQHVLEELPIANLNSWNALISRYTQQGQAEQALECFEEMQRKGFSPDVVTFICMLKACGIVGAADKGEEFHHQIAKQGLLENDVVLGTALVDMYAKCGALKKARCVLEELRVRDAISWNAIIAGYVRHEESMQALKCVEIMQHEGLSPNAVTFICILKACGNIGAVDKGEKFHDEISKQGLLENNVLLGTALVDMYAKCGALQRARGVLDKLPVRNVFSWNALIAGYVQQGEAEQAMYCFEWLQHEGLSPDAATFTCILSACSRLSLIESAQMHFVNMSTTYGMTPDLKQFTCLIDLFGRAGQLDKAVSVIGEMQSLESAVWFSVLGACRKWGDVTVGKWAFEQILQIDKSDAAAYVLMSNIYASAGMGEKADNIEAMRIKNEAWTNQKFSKGWI